MSKTDSHIRPFEPRDYPRLAKIGAQLYPHSPRTPEEIEYWDRERDEGSVKDKPIHWARFVWEEAGEVIAMASYMQNRWMYHPRKFDIDLRVLPAHRQRGIGSGMYRHILTEIEQFQPIKLSGAVCDNQPDSEPFLTKLGYTAGFRCWDSKLDLTSWDPTPFLPALEKLTEQGLEIWDLTRAREELPNWAARIYEMEEMIIRDMSLPETHTPVGLERWSKQIQESPGSYPEAWHLAMDRGEPVALSNLWRRMADKGLGTGLTGVLASHRRRGIAMALKVSSLSFVKEQGHPFVITDNDENNTGMISINKRLGFIDHPSWQVWYLELGD